MVRRVAGAGWLCGVALAAACARPQYGDCAFTCEAGGSCPAAMACEAGWCRVPGETGACDSADAAALDAPPLDARPICWDFAPSNFDSCEIPQSMEEDWLIEDADAILDTSNGATVGPDPPLVLLIDQPFPGVPTLAVVVARNVHVASDRSIVAFGNRPLVIVALGDAVIQGEVSVASSGSDLRGAGSINDCADGGLGGAGEMGGVPTDLPGAGGGGGGGFGGGGGTGGLGGCGSVDSDTCVSDGGAAGAAGGASGDDRLIPLRGGCGGGPGGGGNEGLGGVGGGAVQISARGTLTFRAGRIRAGGGAGGRSTGSRSGGGGGGAGGAILLEAAALFLESGVLLCANGGAGGGVNSLTDSDDGGCTLIPAHGATEGGDGATGDVAPGDGTPGGVNEGGGGAGGGVGRILVRALELIDRGAISTPPYTE